MHQQTVASALAVLLATAPTAWAGMYTKKSPVLQVDAKSYDRLINRSNYTSIVEFYAPWCGHCQNLKPAYEKAATELKGLAAKVAAVDCDDDANKQFCGSMGIKGFPTLKIVRPGKKAGRPVVEDYNGGRTAGAIVKAVAAKIVNHVTRLEDKDLDAFLDGREGPKALLFTEKGTTSALLRSLAIDYLGVIAVAQIRSKEAKAVARFGIDKFPTLVLVPAGGGEPVVYDGGLNKADMVKFLSQAGEPNPDPAPAKSKAGDKKDKKAKADKKDKKPKADKKDKPKADKAQEKKPDGGRDAETEAETTNDASPPPVSTPQVIVIPTASTKQEVSEQCLQPKSHTCILALVPEAETDDSKKAIDSLSQLNTKYIHGHRKVFPFIAVPDSIAATIREKLEVASEVELVAVNARRNWWRRYEGDFGAASVEAWVDVIRMGEGAKKKLPEGIVDVAEVTEEEKVAEAAKENIVEEPKVEFVEVPVEEAKENIVEEPKVEFVEVPVEEPVEEQAEAKESTEEHDEL